MTADPAAFAARAKAERMDLARRDPAGEAEAIHPLDPLAEDALKWQAGLRQSLARVGYVGPGAEDRYLSGEPPDPWPEPMAEAAYHGVMGEIVRAIAPHTEAAPEALLVTGLVIYGAIVGTGPAIQQGAPQGAHLFGVLVGSTNDSRKGTSLANMYEVFDRADDRWRDVLVPGLGSGEGLIAHLKRMEDKDERALILETEFASVLTRMAREGSTLSMTIRDAFDGFPLGRFLAREEAVIHRHHVAFLGHVTASELRARLTTTDKENGFANRFLFVAVRSPHLVARPTPVGTLIDHLAEPLARAIAEARTPGLVTLTAGAEARWDVEYPRLRQGPAGVVGAITARRATHVIRLALVYALLDRVRRIDVAHLEAALAVTDYAERSARYVIGDSTGDAWADEILRALRVTSPISRSQLRAELGFRDAARLTGAIAVLADAGLVRVAIERPGKSGGPAREWVVLR